jgi:hypothetical protein
MLRVGKADDEISIETGKKIQVVKFIRNRCNRGAGRGVAAPEPP